MGHSFNNRESLLDDLGATPTPLLSPGEDPTAAAGATLPPLAWQDVDLRRGCGGNASVNADAVNDNDYGDDYNDDNGGNGNGNDGDGRHNLALALVQPHPHPHNEEDDCDAPPPSWRLALDVETFDGLARSMTTRGSSHVVLRAHHVKKYAKTGPPGDDGGGDDSTGRQR